MIPQNFQIFESSLFRCTQIFIEFDDSALSNLLFPFYEHGTAVDELASNNLAIYHLAFGVLRLRLKNSHHFGAKRNDRPMYCTRAPYNAYPRYLIRDPRLFPQ